MIVGLDMGGTHIDAVIIKDKKIIKTIKKPADKKDLFYSIWETLKDLLKDYDKKDIKRINLSTTVSTNAIVEEKTQRVGMIIQSGPGLNNDFSSCKSLNKFISGYIDHRGQVVENVDLEEVKEARDAFKEDNITSASVITKFSTRNPDNEIKIQKVLEDSFNNITLGHRMSGKLNFPRRVFTSYLNSAVYESFNSFSYSIKKSLEREGIGAPLFILKADGGTMDINTAQERPVETILSGPAASFMGITSLVDIKDDSILLDIGGTTTDIFFLADGVPLFEPLGAKISQYNTLVRAIYSVSIGLGGDSSIRVKDGDLMVGPERKGRPYIFGGPVPTPTDAMVYLGLMNIDHKDSKEKSQQAMDILGKELNLSSKETADLILNQMAGAIKAKTDSLLKEINSKPVYTIKELLHGKVIRPQRINLIGGPAKALLPTIEDTYKLPIYFPENYGVANAIGAALAKTTLDITMTADTDQGKLTVSELGIYEDIPKSYSLDQAKDRAGELLREAALAMGADRDSIETEIIEESSFNMVDGFFTKGKNIRIRAQIKPGHSFKLRSDKDES